MSRTEEHHHTTEWEPLPVAERQRTTELQRLGTLAERYAALAHHPYAGRRVDAVLRGLDVLLAGTVLVLFSPVLVLLAVALLATSGRPLLYRGARVGRAGRTFTMYKLRTLKPDAELRLGRFQDKELDARTPSEQIPLGGLLRASQLDELPQLWNVLRGDMSIVGPRPIRPVFFEQLADEIPQYWQRLVVRPGLTGFAQLRMTRDTTWAEKLAHDLEYLADRSVRLYVRMVLATALRILGRVLGEASRALSRKD